MIAYKFATDSECGTIEAVSFEAACRKLDEMIEGSCGGSGWVEDTDGYRYLSEGEDSCEEIGDDYYESSTGVVFWSDMSHPPE